MDFYFDLIAGGECGNDCLFRRLPFGGISLMLYLDDSDDSAEIIKNEILKAHHVGDDEGCLTTAQVKNLIVEKCVRKGDGFLINDAILEEITKEAQSMLLGSYMSGMASRGELECAWDSDLNDMIWWLPEEKK